MQTQTMRLMTITQTLQQAINDNNTDTGRQLDQVDVTVTQIIFLLVQTSETRELTRSTYHFNSSVPGWFISLIN